MSRWKRARAKKVWIDLKLPYRPYYSIESALKDNPHQMAEDFHKFDSESEYHRYLHLLDCEKEGVISGLIPHPGSYEIVERIILPKNALRRKATRYKQHRVYTPDFYYRFKGVDVYEDYKSYTTTSVASLQHTLFIKRLCEQQDPTSFHFKVVKGITDHPGNE